MRYPVDYIRHAARQLRKMEVAQRTGEAPALPADEMAELLKTLWKAFDEMADAIEALQRARD